METSHECVIMNSAIEGLGVFPKTVIPKGTKIGVVLHVSFLWINISRFGEFINHSDEPTAVLQYIDGKHIAVSVIEIHPDVEITLNYDELPWYCDGNKKHFK